MLAAPAVPQDTRVPQDTPVPQDTRAEVDLVHVDKSERTLTLFSQGQPVRRYTGIQLGDAPGGHKRFQGDERTPEGINSGNIRGHLVLVTFSLGSGLKRGQS